MLQLSAADIVKQFRQRFGIRGAPELSLNENIFGIANLGDLDGPPWHTKGAGVFNLATGPIAAQNSYVGIRAPLTLSSNYRAVVRCLTNFSAQAVYLKVANSALLDAALGAPALNVITGTWDSAPQDVPAPRPSLNSYAVSSAVSFGSPDGYVLGGAVAANQPPMPVYFPWVIAPGNTLFIQGSTVNTAVQAAFYWDEYLLG